MSSNPTALFFSAVSSEDAALSAYVADIEATLGFTAEAQRTLEGALEKKPNSPLLLTVRAQLALEYVTMSLSVCVCVCYGLLNGNVTSHVF